MTAAVVSGVVAAGLAACRDRWLPVTLTLETLFVKTTIKLYTADGTVNSLHWRLYMTVHLVFKAAKFAALLLMRFCCWWRNIVHNDAIQTQYELTNAQYSRFLSNHKITFRTFELKKQTHVNSKFLIWHDAKMQANLCVRDQCRPTSTDD